MRKLYLLLMLTFTCGYAWSQVTVTASSGTPGPSVYTTLKSAFDAINTGTHQGVIAIRISANTTETASAVLNATGSGGAVYTAISVQPTGGSAVSITGSIAGPLIDLDGSDNVVIDGLNTGGNTLTITNSSNAASAATIRFINDATANTITNTTVLGAGSSVTTATILLGAGTVTGNDNNAITNCNIADASPDFPVNAILSIGSATAGQENSNISITGNNISNYFSTTLSSTAILAGAGNTDWIISNNKFFQTATRTYAFAAATIIRVIQVASGTGHIISGNVIGYASAASTGNYTIAGAVATRFIAIDLAVGTSTASSVQNNTIAGFSMITSSNANANTGTGIWCAISVSAGNVNIGTTTPNTIGSNSGTGSIVLNPTVNNGFVVGIASSSPGTVNITNNNIGAIDLVPSGANAGTLVGISTSGTNAVINIENNVIGNTTANNMRIGTASVTTNGGNIRGIFNTATGTVQILSNTIRNLVNNGAAATSLFRGIEYQAGTGSIAKNIVSDLSTGGFLAGFGTQTGVGILVNSTSTGIAVDSNVIYNLKVTNTGTDGAVVSGIFAGNASNASGVLSGINITRNRIYNLSNATASTSAAAPSCIVGISLGNSVLGSLVTVANNMIGLGHAQTTNTSVIGIINHYVSALDYTARIYHNSIEIAGTAASGAQPSFDYYRGNFGNTAFTTPTVDIRNNIFVNNRNGGTGKHYAIANGYPNTVSSATGWPAGASNYNVLKAPETNLGYWNTNVGFADWKTASAGDQQSGSFVVTFQNAPSDLHIAPGGNAASINSAGTPLAAVTIDIDNETRYFPTPDIGADEFAIPFAISMEYFNGQKQTTGNFLDWKASCSAASTTFEVQRSGDSKNFKMLGSISANRERCAAPFSFNDAAPSDGINYYRLKMTESDGRISYSSIIAIINRNAGISIISLNPTIVDKGTAVLQLASAQQGKMQLSVFDLNGRLMHRQPVNVAAGSNTISIDVSKLGAGSYVLQVAAGDGITSTIRFIKQ